MTPEELAEQVRPFVDTCVSRVLVQGREYSDAEGQRFEKVPIQEVIGYAEEELYDLVNYTLMAWIRLQRVREQIARLE